VCVCKSMKMRARRVRPIGTELTVIGSRCVTEKARRCSDVDGR